MHAQAQKVRSSNGSPLRIARVGGGYNVGTRRELHPTPAALSQARLASIETVNVLSNAAPTAGRADCSDYDMSIIEEILRLAEETTQQDYAAGRSSKEITLVRLLQAYEVVLPHHGLVPQEDVYYYRLLLQLSLDPNPDWWAKLDKQRPNRSREVHTAKNSTRRSSKPSVAAGAHAQAARAAARAAASGSSPLRGRPVNRHRSSKSQQQAGAAGAWQPSVPPSSRQTAAAAGLAAAYPMPAVEAAAAAVDAASSAVAAALAEAHFPGSCTGAAAGCGRSSLLHQQQQEAAAGSHAWMGMLNRASQSPAWQATGHPSTSLDPTGALLHWGEQDPITAVASPGAVSYGSLAHRNSTSPCRTPGGPWPRARSLSPAGSTAAGGLSAARQRSRSASPQSRVPRAASSYSFHAGASSSYVHEWCRPSSPYAGAAGVFHPPTATGGPYGYGTASVVGPWALKASASALAIAADMGPSSRCSSPWRAAVAASYLSDLDLDQYVRFSQRMALQHNWRQHLLAAQAARDMQAAAEHRWRLAMSFWEVHCVWRCFQRWRQWAALAAEDSSASYRRWLLLCSFRWWLSMVQHYRRQRKAAEIAVPAATATTAAATTAAAARAADNSLCPAAAMCLQQQGSRPSSPLTGISRLLQQQPHLRPPTSTAAALRQHPSGRMLTACVLSSWRKLVQQRAECAHVQSLLAWHHIQHVQAGAWNKWRVAFEARNPHHKLMRVVYQSRRHSMLRRMVRHWRQWAPAKRSKRRLLRDIKTALSSSEQRRVWRLLQEYTAHRRANKRRKHQAQQHFRRSCLHKHLVQWAHILDIQDAFAQLAASFEEGLLSRRAARMLRWWRDWLELKKQREEQQQACVQYMEAFRATRCLAAWQGRVLRRQRLQELEQQAQYVSAKAAGRAAFRAWHQRAALRKRHQEIMLAIVTNVLRRQLYTAWVGWRAYVLRRTQQKHDLVELTQLDTQRVWQESFSAWCAALHRKVKLLQVTEALQTNMLRRCVRHWKAWVDQKVDWRNFEAQVVQHMLHSKLAKALRQWSAIAARNFLLHDLLVSFLQRSMHSTLQRHFTTWHVYLTQRVAKRMNQLSALLHWEQSLLNKAMVVWLQQTAVWRWKRMRRLRADSYRALRLLDLSLTGWTSVWVEAQEMRQKAAFYTMGRQAELKVLMLRAWGEEAARLKLKRERMEIAGLHSTVWRRQAVIAAWHTEAARRIRLRSLLISSLQRWSQSAVSRAFETWKEWALHRAGLHRRARAVMALLAGRTLQWAFCMMREHALRKRRTRSARHFRAQQLALSVVRAWRQQASDAASFREILVGMGQRLRLGLLSELLDGWRDIVRLKQWKTGSMMRALMLWGGNRKRLCFETWRQWAALKQGKKKALRRALHHWQHLYLMQAFAAWREHAAHMQLARQVIEHFKQRHLQAALNTWRAWYQRKTWLAAKFAELQGKGHQQMLRVVFNAWRAFVPNIRVRRQVMGRALMFWQRRLLAVCFFSWQDYAAHRAHKQQQLAAVLMQWRAWRLQGAFRAWQQTTQLQLYRQHVIHVVSSKLSNGLLLKAFNSWRDLVDAKLTRRERLAAVHTHRARQEINKAFTHWFEVTQEALATRRVLLHWQQRLLSQAFSKWRETVLLKQQHSIIISLVTNKWHNRLLWQAWTAWREVIDQRHQVRGRLHHVAHRWAQADLVKAWDAWREHVLLKQMARMAVAHWEEGTVMRCFRAWRLYAAHKAETAYKAAAYHAHANWRLASSILQEWCELAWELPRERHALELRDLLLQRRALMAWLYWLDMRTRWQQLDAAVTARWTNLHLSAAWRAWREWVVQRLQKRQAAQAVASRWRNLHLAAAFQAWQELVQVNRHHKAVLQTVAGRWRNLHTAAAFGAWRSYVQQRKQSRAAHDAVVRRWTNLHLTAAFGAWREAALVAADRLAAAEAVAVQRDRDLLAAAFLEWQGLAARSVQLRQRARQVAGRWGRLELLHVFANWREAVRCQQAKRAADYHWRLVVLQSLLGLWRSYTRRRVVHTQHILVMLSRTEQQLLRKSLTSWQLYVQRHRHKAAADEYAASKLQQRVFLAWAGLACEAKGKASAAVDMASRVVARMQNQLLYACFSVWQEYTDRHKALKGIVLGLSTTRLRACLHAWRESTAHSKALKEIVLGFTTRRLRSYLHAWREYSQRLAGAAHLLRTLLASTLSGAFHEWRVLARELAHWRRVESQLVLRIQMDDSSTPLLAHQAAARWLNWPLSLAFTTWQQNAAEQVQERFSEKRAVTFLYYALTLKALTGFKWAVQAARVECAAGEHRQGAMKRTVLKSWKVVARHVKEKRHKLIAAVYTYSTNLCRKALGTWLWYHGHRHHKVQQIQQARWHYVRSRKAACFGAWVGTVRYLVPVRRTLEVLQGKKRQSRLQQVFNAWQLQCRRSQLLQHAIARLMHKSLAEAFGGWRQAALDQMRRRALLQSAVTRLSHLLLSRAFSRWYEATQLLKELRAKTQHVVRRTLQRRLRAAYDSWRVYAATQSRKWERLALAVAHDHTAHLSRAVKAWVESVQEARHLQQLAVRMLHDRTQRQLAAMLQWWHMVAQDLHHHRVVLESFRARAVRRDGLAVFEEWREWAHERAVERRAIVARWNRLLVTAFGAWLMYHEQLQLDKAAAYHASRTIRCTMLAWKLALALMHRKRVLTAAAAQLQRRWCLARALQGWMRYTYNRHMGHVALHFRVRRLACMALREWLQAAQARSHERLLSLELTHQLATRKALNLLTQWQHTTAAARHHRARLLYGCLRYWAEWAPQHSAKCLVWREAAQQLALRKLERCFYTWRWYCQVRMLRSVAFQHKQRAIREAVAIGEQVARRRRQALLAATFMAWHVQVSKYRKVAQKLAGLLQHNLTTCFRAWRAATDQARVDMLRAERHAATTTLHKLLPAWLETAQQLRHERECGEAAADRMFRRRTCRTVLQGWWEQLQVVKEQHAGLWHVMLLVLHQERRDLLGDVLSTWHQQAAQQVARRSHIASFVNKRRLECLSDFLTLWHQYTVAMRTEGTALLSPEASLPAAAAAVLGRSAAARSSGGGAGMSNGGYMYSAGPAGLLSYGSGQSFGQLVQTAAGGSPLPAGLLPVTGGPGSPVLGPRSAHQDRRLARRMVAMGGGAAEVDPGSDDEEQLFADLPPTEAAAAGAERQERQQPLLALSKGYRQRRVTLGDDKAQYDDAAEAAAGGYTSPGFDLHSVADSMRQAHEQGLSPWQLPSVRSPRQTKATHPTSLTLDELHSYQQQYPYHLQQQQRSRQQQRQQHPGALLVGRPASAGSAADYQPLLQQQLEAQQRQLEQERLQLQQWQQHVRDRLLQQQEGKQQQQQQQHYEQLQPWQDSGKPRGQIFSPQQEASKSHWSQRRGDLLGAFTATTASSNSSSRSASASSASAQAGSHDAYEQQVQMQQQQLLHHKMYGKWAGIASRQQQQQQQRPASAAANGSAADEISSSVMLPSFEGEVLPRSLAALVTPSRPRGVRSSNASGGGAAGSGGGASGAAPITPPCLGPRGTGTVGSLQQQQQQRRVSNVRARASSSSGGGGAAGPSWAADKQQAPGFSLGAWDYVKY